MVAANIKEKQICVAKLLSEQIDRSIKTMLSLKMHFSTSIIERGKHPESGLKKLPI